MEETSDRNRVIKGVGFLLTSAIAGVIGWAATSEILLSSLIFLLTALVLTATSVLYARSQSSTRTPSQNDTVRHDVEDDEEISEEVVEDVDDTLDSDKVDTSEESETVDSGAVTFGNKVRAAVSGKTVIDDSTIDEPLEELQLNMISSDVDATVAEDITDGVRERLVGTEASVLSSKQNIVQDSVQESITDVLNSTDSTFDELVSQHEKPVVIIFAGVNGVGKTTTIAKVAKRFQDRGESVVIANGDTYRDGADEQIQTHADRLGIKCITHEQGGDPAAVVYDGIEYAEANDVDYVLADTAGRLSTSDDLMRQLEKIERVTNPDITLLVDEMVAGQDTLQRSKEFGNAIDLDGLVLTKADASNSHGPAVSLSYEMDKPIFFLGTGQEYDDLEEFDSSLVSEKILVEQGEKLESKA